MQPILGYLFLVTGLVVTVLPVLAWLKVIQPREVQLTGTTGTWDAILQLLQKLPWVSVLGIFLVVAGLLLTGLVKIPT